MLFDWKLQNLNIVQQNAASIDLVDYENKLIVQVSATATKQKIESALAKDLSKYKGHAFKFISISKDARDLRAKTFSNPHNLIFVPAEDIFDVPSLLRLIKSMEIDRQQEVYEFVKKELKGEPNIEKVETNLATIIKILSQVDWKQETLSFETIPFDIEPKISYNQLTAARSLIDDFKIYYHRIEKIYSDFDKQGVNKSFSVLNGIRSEYLSMGTVNSPDQYFFDIIEKVTQKIRESDNYTPIPDEELELCVQILVVDAFMRCKIFKNPKGDANAHS
ncbi:MAG: ABC-three component system protein [bacterium]